MTETKWTPGPWHISGKKTIKAGDAWIGKANWQNGEANAHLIAAAPEMAEALEYMLAKFGRDMTTPDHDRIAAILAKARGEDV